MKVLQINSVCGNGSTGRIATDINSMLIEQGHESYIAYGRYFSNNYDNAISIGSKYNNYCHVALTRVFDRHGFGSKKATLKFIKRVKEMNPDIIHLHNIHGYYINIELLFEYLKGAKKPVVWTLHDCWAFTGHCSYFDYVGCDRWKTSCFNCIEKKSYPSSLFVDNSKNNYQLKKNIFNGVNNLTIVSPSKWLAELVKESYLSNYQVNVINNGIDLKAFKPTQSNFRKTYNIDNKFIILGVASVWDRRKGFKYFVELSDKLKNDEIIILVGLSAVQKKELPENIIGITKTNNIQELAEIYTAADVFVNLTQEDNFPTTNLEALACGTPVITFETGGSVECVNCNTGAIVKKGNIEELLYEIGEIKKKGKSFYSENAKERAIKYYNKEDRFKEYIDLYKKNSR